MEEAESYAKDQLAALQREYHERAKPFIDILVSIQSLRPMPPMIVDIRNIDLLMLEQLKRKAGEA